MVAASVGGRRLTLIAAAACYAGVSLSFVLWESPGLGIGHLFVVPICLVALVTNELVGALAGVLATALYVGSVVAAPKIAPTHALTSASLIRLIAYVAVGALIGFFASRNRQLVERLRDIAERDFVTGLGNARRFDEELGRRCASDAPFSLVLADVDDLAELNDRHGHAAGNAALKRVGEVLQQHAQPEDVVARIGGDEFALLTTLPPEQIAALAARTNRALAPERLGVTFGTTSAPEVGQTAAELFHKADDRLFAAKLVRQNRTTVLSLTDRTA